MRGIVKKEEIKGGWQSAIHESRMRRNEKKWKWMTRNGKSFTEMVIRYLYLYSYLYL